MEISQWQLSDSAENTFLWGIKFIFSLAFLLCVQNMLELKLYDQDVVTKDDLLFTVVYDTVKIRPGDTVYESFILNSEVRHED